MNKIFVPFLMIALLVIGSCSKSTNNPIVGGSWLFQGVTYYNSAGGTVSNDSILDVGSNNPLGNITMYFSTSSISAGTYEVVHNGSTASGNYVSIQTQGNLNNNTYYSTGSGTQYITVTSAANNRLSMAGTNIPMRSATGDTASLTIGITAP